MAATEPIRDEYHARTLATHLLEKGEIRNYVMVTVGMYTALRISDILRLYWDDVYDFEKSRVRREITVVEKKTRKARTIALNKNVVKALEKYVEEAARGKPLIVNKNTGNPISRVQAHRIVTNAAEKAKIPGKVSCHSLRKTFGYHAWKKGTPPAVIMDIYNHSSYETTRRYLGITQDDRNAVYLGMEYTA